MIKRRLFVIVCALNLTMALCAQVFSDSELKSLGATVGNGAIQEECRWYYLKADYNFHYNLADKLFDFTYTLNSSSAFQLSEIFNAFDVDTVKERVIKGIIKNVIEKDPSRRKREALVNFFKTQDVPIKVYIRYEKNVKLATATPEEFQKLASLHY